MNKQEIEHKIDQCNKNEGVIRAQREALEAQLAEAEKPKLGHGDFGPNKEGKIEIVLWNHVKGFDWSKPLGERRNYSDIGIMGEKEITPFFNIFNLTADWDKDFKNNWESGHANIGDKRRIVVDILGSDIFLGTVGDAGVFSPETAYEIWKQLGHAIIQTKTKQGVTR